MVSACGQENVSPWVFCDFCIFALLFTTPECDITCINYCTNQKRIIEVIQKVVLFTMNIAPHPSAMLTCSAQGDVLEIFEDL